MGSRYILIVDDDEEILHAVRALLMAHGYRVESALDGAEALARLRRDDSPGCTLVLLDLVMPRLNGWRFREEQLRDPRLRAIPVVIMTATSTLAEAAVDGDGFVNKPLLLQEVLDEVRRVLALAQRADAAR